MENRTSLVIAHRLTTVLAADSIMVLENGKISDTGTHDELMRSSAQYKLLYETQFKKVLEHEKNSIHKY